MKNARHPEISEILLNYWNDLLPKSSCQLSQVKPTSCLYKKVLTKIRGYWCAWLTGKEWGRQTSPQGGGGGFWTTLQTESEARIDRFSIFALSKLSKQFREGHQLSLEIWSGKHQTTYTINLYKTIRRLEDNLYKLPRSFSPLALFYLSPICARVGR